MNTKELVLCALGFMLLSALISSPVACTMNRHNMIARAIESGADPIAAKCAIEGGNDNSTVCIAYAASRQAAEKPDKN